MNATAPHAANTHPTPADLIIEPRWLIPVEPFGTVLEHQAVIVREGEILDVLPARDAQTRYTAPRHEMLGDHALIPGLINLHCHAAMTLLRGYADDLPLMRWLQERIWPAEGKLISHDFVRDGTLLAAAEMLRGGITCFNDMYFYPEAAAEAALEAGIRAELGIVAIEFPSSYGSDADDYLTKGLAARDRHRQDTLIGFTLAPHAPYTVSDRTFERIATLAAQLELPIHVHLHETQDEITQSIDQYGVRPLERLRRLGLVGPDLIAVHAVHITPDEIELLAQHGASLAHCPTSNMKLASGIAPIHAAKQHRLNCGLGTDGAASNNRLDMFQEMRLAALLAKVASGDAAALDAHAALHMATLGGATALGKQTKLGSIRRGKAADLTAVRLDEWQIQPCFDPSSHLVYTAGREHVSHVWVAGRLAVANGQLCTLQTARMAAIAALWQNKLAA